MSLIYITGQTGTGKTTLRNIFRERGYEAHDSDEDGLARHYDRYTGQPIEYPTSPVDRTEEFWDKQAYNLSIERISALTSRAHDKLIFLCGAAANDTQLTSYFGAMICLFTDEDTIKVRLATRTTNHYGKALDELEGILRNHEIIITKYQEAGAIMLRSEGSPDEMADKVLALVNAK